MTEIRRHVIELKPGRLDPESFPTSYVFEIKVLSEQEIKKVQKIAGIYATDLMRKATVVEKVVENWDKFKRRSKYRYWPPNELFESCCIENPQLAGLVTDSRRILNGEGNETGKCVDLW